MPRDSWPVNLEMENVYITSAVTTGQVPAKAFG